MPNSNEMDPLNPGRLPTPDDLRFKPKETPDPQHTPLPSWTAPALGAMIGAFGAIPAFQQYDGPMAWILTGVMMFLGLLGGLIILGYDIARR
ncbi:hypothetical protein Q31b_52740 [Novipirellula aureliae]|uniref:Uncharacterized protein n=1 Tax=Novipirellula aureliae TaxID=2527966 RepID=A0A5C6DLU6_9BACT|nr:hypothetical protein [Novipirellula aureliae]TWU35839.1 hypothetical protein Q31b_52740 [Novipirellula aureliae]